MKEERVLEILREAGVLLEGHFKLTSGKHSPRYLQCAKAYQWPKHGEELSEALAEKFKDMKIDMVIGPAIGGILIAYEVGKALEVKAIFAERENGVMSLRRGFDIAPNSNVLVVEDVVTTGGSVKEVIEIVKNYGANVIGVASLVDRSGGKVDFGVEYKSLISFDIPTYEEYECPMCKDGSPCIKPGSRKMA
ncbi:orotate phosphoribosyltransferase [Oxobacter pfennigii]|uniref:Orotate phosphoribosyltransferase n=1 Tax=Oxobacter pfennigii TaxID=36849 RepID=A0A0P8W7L1_9CLOT|nr:orotate phosphoribosyltransferase [Oxobacter pfennigii]KPU44646.1 orotate phosphoribosyltransferase [Oxobacter pfennigii]